jgi:hypothetical protein
MTTANFEVETADYYLPRLEETIKQLWTMSNSKVFAIDEPAQGNCS